LTEFNEALQAADFATLAGSERLSNKRNLPRVLAQATLADPWQLEPDLGTANVYVFTALDHAITITPPVSSVGAFGDAELLSFVFYGDSAQTLTFSTAATGFSAGPAMPLPTTTKAAEEVRYTFERSARDGKWHFVGSDFPSGPLALAYGGLGISSGTSGGIPYFASTSTIASSAALTANLPVFGGGAGVAPFSGTRSGNSTKLVSMDASTPNTNDCAKWDANGNLTTAGAACGGSAFGVRSLYIPAGSMDVSGSCAPVTAAALLTNGPKLPTIGCTDNDADSIEFDWVSADGWDAGTITVELVAFSIGNSNTEVFEMDFAGQCVTTGDTPTAHSTTGEQAATITWGNAANREQHATTAAITLQGTCAAGDHIYMRGQVDAGATTMTPMTDLRILGVKIEWTRSAND
jgi:hypothetical protein